MIPSSRSVSVFVLMALWLLTPQVSVAFTGDEQCEAIRMVAMGQRISSKLQCRAWAKLTDAPVQQFCLDVADQRFLKLVTDAGPGCADAGLVVEMGGGADAVMSEIVGAVEGATPAIPDISGLWELRTVVAANPDPMRDGSLYCDSDPTCPDELVIVECDTEIVQDGDRFEQSALCRSADDSRLYLEPFSQSGAGAIDLVTGETVMEGEVEVFPSFFVYFKGEGSYGPDAQSSTMTTTAGADGNWLWLSVTTGRRLGEAGD
ncbi:MAG: hypothetical protein P8R42_12495 [Candidatus Binatia bacterium]|nr:hypothetical protein [Candidatus Binatia bacterium]